MWSKCQWVSISDDLVNFHDTLRTIEDRVQRLIAAGSSVAEILAAAPSAEFDPV